MNRDTLYSSLVSDLDAADVTIVLPDAGKRFMSMQVIDEDHYTPMVVYEPGAHTFTKAQIGTRYVAFAVRTFVDPNDPSDLKAAHALHGFHEGATEQGGRIRGASLGRGVVEEDPRCAQQFGCSKWGTRLRTHVRP
jgi:hypothetical protein